MAFPFFIFFSLINNYINSKLGWKLLYSDAIVPTSATASYTPTVTLDANNIHEVFVAFMYGQPTASTLRLSLVVTGSDFLNNLAFPDFYFAASRLYCAVYPSSGKIVVNQAGSSGSTSWSSTAGKIKLYYR